MKAGDRVEYTGTMSANRTGQRGTVGENWPHKYVDSFRIKWDNFPADDCGYDASNFTVISKFKVGDRVVGTNMSRFHGHEGVITKPFVYPKVNYGEAWWVVIDGTERDLFAYDLELVDDDVLRVGDRVEGGPEFFVAYRRGKRGTVTKVDAKSTDVMWDNDPYPQAYFQSQIVHLIKLKGTSVDIETALKVLRDAGTVTFVPKKPPFVSQHIPLGTYTAVVDDKYITVGCQKIDFHKFDSIASAVGAARAYNAA